MPPVKEARHVENGSSETTRLDTEHSYAGPGGPSRTGSRVPAPATSTSITGKIAHTSPPAQQPSVTSWAQHFCTGLLDVMAGRRSVTSIRRWMSSELYARVQDELIDQGVPERSSVLAQPFSTRVWEVGKDKFEVACTVWDRGQMRAIAVRIEKFRGRMVAVALEYG